MLSLMVKSVPIYTISCFIFAQCEILHVQRTSPLGYNAEVKN